MATRSNIGLLLPNGKIASIYCHSDGYLSYNGKMLLTHYQDVSKVFMLIAGGSISCLDEKINGHKNHSFDNRVENQTVFYRRDKKEKDVDCRIVDIECFHEEEYSYYFNMIENKWYYSDGECDFTELTLELCNNE
jgi:hypothetical protein